MNVVNLASDTDIDGFRQHSRALFAQGVPPEAVTWQVMNADHGDLFGQTGAPLEEPGNADGSSNAAMPAVVAATAAADSNSSPTSALESPPEPAAHPPRSLSVPPAFLTLAQTVILHRDPRRFGLLYRLVWRLSHEPGLRHDPLDADRVQAEHWAQAVRHDMHKMKAFVRFRRIDADSSDTSSDASAPDGPHDRPSDVAEPDHALPSRPPMTLDLGDSNAPTSPWHVAWFEPEHHIVEATAPFFARRFTAMRWAILTPERSVRWDGEQLAFGPGADRSEAPPADAGEALWLTYYQSIFNPARLKLKMMKKEMPVRYWHNLPEAALIGPLTAGAAERSGRMVEEPPTEPTRRLPAPPPRPAVAQGASSGGSNTRSGSKPGVNPRLDHHLSNPADTDLHLMPTSSPDTAPPDPGRPPTAAAEIPSLADLPGAMNRCRACPIGDHATQAVPGDGATSAALMLVGEQPGDQEDLRGRPFVGPAGQLLARAMAELGWPRDAVFITNAVKHFKFELRGQRRIHKTPTQREAAVCLDWLEREIELVRPQALVALGATAARSLLGRAVAITRERGQWFHRDDGLPVLVTLHPSALLRMVGPEREAAYAPWVADLALASEHLHRSE